MSTDLSLRIELHVKTKFIIMLSKDSHFSPPNSDDQFIDDLKVVKDPSSSNLPTPLDENIANHQEDERYFWFKTTVYTHMH